MGKKQNENENFKSLRVVSRAPRILVVDEKSGYRGNCTFLGGRRRNGKTCVLPSKQGPKKASNRKLDQAKAK